MATKKVNIDIIAKDKSKRALNNVRGSLDKLKSSVFNVRNALAGLGAGLVIRNIINTGKELENLQTRFKFLLKDANEGAKAFENLTKFASQVPFSLEEIQAGSGILATVTDNADDLQKMLEITGNVAATTGLDFRTAAEQIQRSFSAGIGAADLFREKGVRNMLGFKAGATVSIEETVEAFERVFGDGGQFGSATDELAQTLEGTLSMINDKVFTFKKTLLDAGFFAQLKKEFGDLDKFLANNSKTLDEIAISIGKGMAEAVKFLADAVVFVKDNFSSFVLVLEGLIALKVAKVLFGIQTAIAGMTVAMNGFNMATKKNIIFASISTFVTGMGFLIHKFKQFKNEVNEQNQIVLDNTSTIADYKEEIDKLSKKIAEMESLGKVMDEAGTPITALKVTLEILEEELEGLKEVINETSNSTAALGQSLHGNFHTILKEGTKSLKEYKDALVDMNIEQARLEDRQFGMSPADREKIRVHLENIEKDKLRILKSGHIDRVFEQDRMLDEQIGLELDQLQEFEKIEKFKGDLFTEMMSKRHRKEQELIRQNEEKKVALKKQAEDTIFNNTRSSLQAVSGLNRTAFEAFKRFRIAEATIEAVKGAATAFSTYAANPFLATAVAASHLAKGMALVAQIKSTNFREKGGPVSQGKPFIVGEKGPELFVPNQSGNIIANNKMGGSPVAVTFNINTVDARGFNELLTNSRGTIVSLINSAVNETGRQAVV
jgi:hypothetical protein